MAERKEAIPGLSEIPPGLSGSLGKSLSSPRESLRAVGSLGGGRHRRRGKPRCNPTRRRRRKCKRRRGRTHMRRRPGVGGVAGTTSWAFHAHEMLVLEAAASAGADTSMGADRCAGAGTGPDAGSDPPLLPEHDRRRMRRRMAQEETRVQPHAAAPAQVQAHAQVPRRHRIPSAGAEARITARASYAHQTRVWKAAASTGADASADANKSSGAGARAGAGPRLVPPPPGPRERQRQNRRQSRRSVETKRPGANNSPQETSHNQHHRAFLKLK